MLPLIAFAEKAPLVIDQPEDDLDNRLVGGVLTRILAELKEQRQIIVCTHNPNILVGGDAEQVIVLEAESDKKATVAGQGSIDNPASSRPSSIFWRAVWRSWLSAEDAMSRTLPTRRHSAPDSEFLPDFRDPLGPVVRYRPILTEFLELIIGAGGRGEGGWD
jgi:hypothetical protein